MHICLVVSHCTVLCCAVWCSVPLDEVIQEVFDSLLHLRFLQGDWVTFVGDLHNQLPQFVQLTLDLEETLGRQSKPERGEVRGDFTFKCYVTLVWVQPLLMRIHTGADWTQQQSEQSLTQLSGQKCICTDHMRLMYNTDSSSPHWGKLFEQDESTAMLAKGEKWYRALVNGCDVLLATVLQTF